jgi:hypothetical protein
VAACNGRSSCRRASAAKDVELHDLEASTVGDLPSTTLTTLLEALAKVEANLAAAVARS